MDKEPKIIFEDESFLVLNKPAGLIVHPDGRNEEKSLVDFLLKKYPKIKKVGESIVLPDGTEILRPGIVHRIDRDTSGILLVAKSDEAYANLKEQFQSRKIKKTYHTFVYGLLKEERGTIDKPIGRSVSSVLRRSASANARGELREAITKYKTIKADKDASFLEVWPLTGRTHQIRVHLKSIHHSIICDDLYASHKPSLLGFKRLALHASKIIFKDLDGNEKEFQAEFPEDFVKAMKKMEIKLK